MISRKQKKVIITLIVVMIIVLISPPLLMRLKAAAVVFNLLITDGNWRPLQLTTVRPSQHDITVKNRNDEALTVRLYVPRSIFNPRQRTGLIINTPFIGGGLDDPRLKNIAETFSRAGFVTAIPWQHKSDLIVSETDTDNVVATAHHLLSHQVTGSERSVVPEIDQLGIFGISYGNGPAIAAATDTTIKDTVSFIISLNGLYDLRNVINFITTGNHSYQDNTYYKQPHSYPGEILDATLSTYRTDLNTFLSSQDFDRLYSAISPSVHVGQINSDFYIVHSADDNYIPYTESMHLRDALSDRLNVTFTLTNVVEHGTYRPINSQNLRRYYLPAAIDFYTMIRLILTRHT